VYGAVWLGVVVRLGHRWTPARLVSLCGSVWTQRLVRGAHGVKSIGSQRVDSVRSVRLAPSASWRSAPWGSVRSGSVRMEYGSLAEGSCLASRRDFGLIVGAHHSGAWLHAGLTADFGARHDGGFVSASWGSALRHPLASGIMAQGLTLRDAGLIAAYRHLGPDSQLLGLRVGVYCYGVGVWAARGQVLVGLRVGAQAVGLDGGCFGFIVWLSWPYCGLAPSRRIAVSSCSFR
jgi:hypothetical protein